MTKSTLTKGGEADFWKSAFGHQWIDFESSLDVSMSGVLERLLEYADLNVAQNVLDIGCGTGASSLAAADIVGASGQVDAADISTVLLERARQKALLAEVENVKFELCDAQIHPFPKARYDRIMSRFGMMFFDAPVTALENIAKAGKPGCRLVFVTWAQVSENPWFAIPRQVAVDRLGDPGVAKPRAPGPFAFQDIGYVKDLLISAGLSDITGQEISCELTPPGDIAATANFASQLGPAARIIQEFEGTQEDARAIADGVAQGFSAFLKYGEFHIPATLNMFTASCR